jgi:RNA recognition motif-containing protein
MPGQPGQQFRQMVPPQQMFGGPAGNFPQPIFDQFAHMNLGGGQRYNNNHAAQRSQKRQDVKKILNELPSLHVKNLPSENFYDLDFFKFFNSRGYRVKNAKVVLDKHPGRTRGYGYLQFIDRADAEKCMKEMNNQLLNGLQLCISWSSANPKEK